MNTKISKSAIITVMPVILSIWTLLIIPFQVLGYGFLPPDDALRHSAKVISGKDWSQILILRDDITMDSHPGWHAILGVIHRITTWDAHSLVLFSVIFLFILFSLTPLLFLRYPESWLCSLITISIFAESWILRLFLGRPYIFTMAVLLTVCFLWPSLKNKKIPFKIIIFFVIAIALSAWVHCAWYLFALPIIAFFLAREWRAGILFSICTAVGVAIGVSLTGHPIIFLQQTIKHLFLAFGSVDVRSILVTEFQPALADVGIIMMVAGMIVWRSLRGRWDKKIVDNPVFILAVISFVLAFVSRRVFIDWGLPALAVWMANEFNEFFGSTLNTPWRRIALSIVACFVLYLSITADAVNRWSKFKPADYLSVEDHDQRPWLPEPGGIIYSDDMMIFYTTFFKNPNADWRYILGFEPAIMPQEDLKIFRDIQQNRTSYKYFYPWVKKMTPKDRLIIRGSPDSKPKIPELEWYYAAQGTWAGRLPRNSQAK